MNTMVIFYVIWAVWLLSEIILNILLRSGKKDQKGQDKGTFSIIWIAIALANSSGIIIAAKFDFAFSDHLIIAYIGLLLIIAGMIIRLYSIYSLGRLFTVNVTIREDHKIKQDGIYRLVRHPSYSGSILSFIGFGMSLNNWLSLAIIFIFVTVAMLIRIRI